MLFDIIIVSATKNDYFKVMTQNAINSCINSGGDFKFYVIETFNFNVKYEHAEVIYYKDEFNYHKCMNLGISRSDSAIIAICNNDIIFHDKWATNIAHVFKYHPEYDSLCPYCPGYHDNIHKIPKGDHLKEGWDTGRLVPGWCIVFRRSILKKIGKLNEEVGFWYSDNIYCQQLITHRIKHALVCNSFVEHLQSGSRTLYTETKERQGELTHKQKKLYQNAKKSL